MGDCSLVRGFCSPKVRKSEIKGSSFRRFCSPKVRKSDNEIDSFLFRRFCSPKVRKSEIKVHSVVRRPFEYVSFLGKSNGILLLVTFNFKLAFI